MKVGDELKVMVVFFFFGFVVLRQHNCGFDTGLRGFQGFCFQFLKEKIGDVLRLSQPGAVRPACRLGGLVGSHLQPDGVLLSSSPPQQAVHQGRNPETAGSSVRDSHSDKTVIKL